MVAITKIDPSKLDALWEKLSDNTWRVQLEEDPESGELVMPIPDEILKTLGCAIGDVMTWDMDDATGTITLRKKS